MTVAYPKRNAVALATVGGKCGRLEAMLRFGDQLTPEEYWDELGWAWAMSDETPTRYLEPWRELFERDLPDRENLMMDYEQEELAGMAERFVIYRGHTKRKARLGLSWTINRQTADDFARKKYAGQPYLTTGVVFKSDVIAFLDRNGEEEIFVFPEHVELIGTEKLA